jgi:hypothetical protein
MSISDEIRQALGNSAQLYAESEPRRTGPYPPKGTYAMRLLECRVRPTRFRRTNLNVAGIGIQFVSEYADGGSSPSGSPQFYSREFILPANADELIRKVDDKVARGIHAETAGFRGYGEVLLGFAPGSLVGIVETIQANLADGKTCLYKMTVKDDVWTDKNNVLQTTPKEYVVEAYWTTPAAG